MTNKAFTSVVGVRGEDHVADANFRSQVGVNRRWCCRSTSSRRTVLVEVSHMTFFLGCGICVRKCNCGNGLSVAWQFHVKCPAVEVAPY